MSGIKLVDFTRPVLVALGIFALQIAQAQPPVPQKPIPKRHDLQPNCYLPSIPEQVVCDNLTVAEDPSQPEGAQISLQYAILPALVDAKPKEALLVLTGGPGQSALDYAHVFNARLQKIRQRRDIVLVDQRGTGKSNPLQCQAMNEVQALDADDRAVDYRALAETCLAELSAQPQYYSTSNVVNDLEQLRASLGYQYWHLYGVSYGTRIAQLYLAKHPKPIKSATLDGVVAPTHHLLDVATNAQMALEQLVLECQSDLGCQRRFPDLSLQLTQMAARLAKKPQRGLVLDPLTNQASPLLLTENKWHAMVRASLYSDQTRRMLPYVIEAAYQGNYQPLVGIGSAMQRGLALAMGMHASVACSEDWPRVSAEQQGALNAAPSSRQLLNFYRSVCDVWPTQPADRALFTPVTTDVPVLLLSGAFDPATPPQWAEAARVNMTQSRHVVAPYAAHGLVTQTCANRVMAEFIDEPVLSALKTECLTEQQPRQFWQSLNAVEPERGEAHAPKRHVERGMEAGEDAQHTSTPNDLSSPSSAASEENPS